MFITISELCIIFFVILWSPNPKHHFCCPLSEDCSELHRSNAIFVSQEPDVKIRYAITILSGHSGLKHTHI